LLYYLYLDYLHAYVFAIHIFNTSNLMALFEEELYGIAIYLVV